MNINALHVFWRYFACALILLGCGYMVMDALTNFLDLVFIYTYRKKPWMGIAYLFLAIFFCYAAVMFIYPNYYYIYALYPTYW